VQTVPNATLHRTDVSEEPPREDGEEGDDDEREGGGDGGHSPQVAAVSRRGRGVGEASLDQGRRPEIRLPVGVEQVADEGDRPDDGVDPEDERDPAERRPRHAGARGDGEDVRRHGEAEAVTDDRQETDQRFDPDAEVGSRNLYRIVEQVAQVAEPTEVDGGGGVGGRGVLDGDDGVIVAIGRRAARGVGHSRLQERRGESVRGRVESLLPAATALLTMTSVKEFRVEREPTATATGRGRFAFTDDYSVFDWGGMPDRIPDKGRSLCTMGAFNFERLERAGVPTHYRGVGPDAVPLAEAGEAPRELAIDLVQVPDLPFADGTYDYDAYHGAAGSNYLIPLEIVFRNTVPVGSSLRKRGAPGDYGLAYDAWPDDPVDLPEPVVEFSTKYEEQDRYVGRAAADRIAGAADVDALADLAHEVNRVVTDRAAETGFVHEDGKIECCYVDGEIRVADVVGTFDENRFAYEGQEVSKEVVRQYYKRTHPEWVEAVSEAKAEADRRGVADWRPLCSVEPKPLPTDVVDAVADMYAAGANAYTGEAWFDAPDIGAAVDAVRDL